MAITKVADMSNSVVAKYMSDYYLIAAQNPGLWAQFIDWQTPVPEDGGGGSSYNFPIFGESDLVESALSDEAGELTPETLYDDAVTLTPAQYGKTWEMTKLLRAQSRVNLPTVMAEIAAMNRIKSIDRFLRRGAVGHGSTRPTHTIHVDGSTAMTSLTSTDVITWDFIMELVARAQAIGMEPVKGAGYVAIVHPMLFMAIRGLTEVKSVGYYQKPENIYNGVGEDDMFKVGGVTFISSRTGKIFPSAGTVLQSATTIATACNKGATTVVLTDATGIAVGNWIALGTIESESVSPGANLEKVQVTAVDTNTLTIRGNGRGNNFGLRFDHAAGESALEAYDVAAIPIIGRNSLIGIHGSDSGKYGLPKFRAPIDVLGLKTSWGWYWYGGVAAVQKNLILGKVALPAASSVLGYN